MYSSRRVERRETLLPPSSPSDLCHPQIYVTLPSHVFLVLRVVVTSERTLVVRSSGPASSTAVGTEFRNCQNASPSFSP